MKPWTLKDTQKDRNKGYIICPICKENMAMLNSGTELKRIPRCNRCGESDLVSVKEYQRGS